MFAAKGLVQPEGHRNAFRQIHALCKIPDDEGHALHESGRDRPDPQKSILRLAERGGSRRL